MTPLDAMKQALEVFTHCYAETERRAKDRAKSLADLKAAIAELEKVDPVAWHGVTGDYGYAFLSFQEQPGMTPLYTHPKETQEQLTGEK